MRVLIGYDGSESADAALDDLKKAGLPRDLKVLIVSVGEIAMPPSLIGSEVTGMPVTPESIKMALAAADAQTAHHSKRRKSWPRKLVLAFVRTSRIGMCGPVASVAGLPQS